MALTLLQRKKMQKGLILIFGAVLFITVTVLWIGFFQGKPASVAEPKVGTKSQSQSIKINFDVLSLPLLQELDIPTEPMIEPLLKGRDNPFLPF